MHPLRNVAGVFRRADGTSAYPAGPSISAGPPAGDAPAGPASASNPFAWSGDDPVSRAVRAGCDVVEQAVRRGFGVAGDPSTGPAWAGGLLQGPWTTGQWVDAMTGAFTTWAQWMDAWSSIVRAAMGGAAEPGGWPSAASQGSRSGMARPPSPSSPSSPPSSSPSSSPASGTGALHLTLELRTARAASVELDLSPGAATDFEVHGLLAPAAAAAPPITDVSLAVVDGGVRVTLGSIDQHPAGVYAGAVLAAGRACGTLTVRLT
jgi:hypothetical protein